MTGYLYRGSPELERVNAQIMEWRAIEALRREREVRAIRRRDPNRCRVGYRGSVCQLRAGHDGRHRYSHDNAPDLTDRGRS